MQDEKINNVQIPTESEDVLKGVIS